MMLAPLTWRLLAGAPDAAGAGPAVATLTAAPRWRSPLCRRLVSRFGHWIGFGEPFWSGGLKWSTHFSVLSAMVAGESGGVCGGQGRQVSVGGVGAGGDPSLGSGGSASRGDRGAGGSKRRVGRPGDRGGPVGGAVV